mgnify:CR=1 FL=1
MLFCFYITRGETTNNGFQTFLSDKDLGKKDPPKQDPPKPDPPNPILNDLEFLTN